MALVPAPLLVFDFDGVLVDGMEEYWWSSRRAALDLLGAPPQQPLPEAVPPAFRQLRPLIHKGWEMVLVAAELGRAAGPGDMGKVMGLVKTRLAGKAEMGTVSAAVKTALAG